MKVENELVFFIDHFLFTHVHTTIRRGTSSKCSDHREEAIRNIITES
jgi:hypothetical protein